MSKNDLISFQADVNRPLILDGAIGSLLQQRNIEIHKHLWSSFANISNPEKIVEIHNEYIKAGADIVTTNTFRTNPIAYKKSSLEISNSELVKKSVELTRIAVGENKNIFIAGSNPPAEDSYQTIRTSTKKEILSNHFNHIDMLWDSGVDFILNETQSHFDEIKIICNHCSQNKIPFILSLFVTEKGDILSGESIDDVIQFISEFNPIAVGINCVTPKIFSNSVSEINSLKRWGFYLNCGSGYFTDKEIFEGIAPSNYLDIIKNNIAKNPFFVGTCCGSSPKHIKLIKEYLVGNY